MLLVRHLDVPRMGLEANGNVAFNAFFRYDEDIGKRYITLWAGCSSYLREEADQWRRR